MEESRATGIFVVAVNDRGPAEIAAETEKEDLNVPATNSVPD